MMEDIFVMRLGTGVSGYVVLLICCVRFVVVCRRFFVREHATLYMKSMS
jgi:hypothetical protein